jgi:hypothetical protein
MCNNAIYGLGRMNFVSSNKSFQVELTYVAVIFLPNECDLKPP